jgi:hypothetical protein
VFTWGGDEIFSSCHSAGTAEVGQPRSSHSVTATVTVAVLSLTAHPLAAWTKWLELLW